MTAASVVDSFEYLINNCTKEEAWRRIKIMRKAIRAHKQESQAEHDRPKTDQVTGLQPGRLTQIIR